MEKKRKQEKKMQESIWELLGLAGGSDEEPIAVDETQVSESPMEFGQAGHTEHASQDLHHLFHYVMREKAEHTRICLEKKFRKLKFLKHCIKKLTRRVDVYNEKIEQLKSQFQATGEPVYKKEAILAQLENQKHEIKLQFLENLFQSLLTAVQSEGALLQKQSQFL
jgi:hypothetical protein